MMVNEPRTDRCWCVSGGCKERSIADMRSVPPTLPKSYLEAKFLDFRSRGSFRMLPTQPIADTQSFYVGRTDLWCVLVYGCIDVGRDLFPYYVKLGTEIRW